ncbi:hypothetical protein CO705_14190 [Ralstonia pickettii]|nr:hypothetical protein CO705_14190 [Ralstonia pickettii]
MGLHESEFNRTFRDKNDREISLELDEDSLIVKATHNGTLIGKMEFVEIEQDRGPSAYKLIWMYLDMAGPEYKSCGIGQKILELMNEFTGGPIIAGSGDGRQSDDGSHLTGDGPGFVAKMRSRGLIYTNPYDEF